MKKSNSPLKIVHISDFHLGSVHYDKKLMDMAIKEINEINPEIIIVTGDLTDEGLEPEYRQAKKILDSFRCARFVITPGNHDSRNVGYVHFERLFGARRHFIKYKGINIVSCDSSEPDLNNGAIGRSQYFWLKDNFKENHQLKIFVLHHHLVSVPGTGRERNIVYDAGDVLELLNEMKVNLVLSGHKHVPFAWKLENIHLVTAGTVSCLRLRGMVKPSYNIINIDPNRVKIFRRAHPISKEKLIVDFAFPE